MNKERRITQAITCTPGKNFAAVTGGSVGIPDLERALLQHWTYCDALEKCGVQVTSLPAGSVAGPGLIQSAAVVTDYLAVMGDLDGKKDLASMLAGARCLKFIMPPGRLDGRDVFQAKDHFYISLSEDTNEEGAAQLAYYLNEYGYQTTLLHLEHPVRLAAAAVDLGANRLLLRGELALHFAFLAYDKITVPHAERRAADARMVNGTLIMPAGHPETRAAVREAGIPVIEVNVSEFEKVDGGLSGLALTLSESRNPAKIEIPGRAETRRLATG